MEKDEIAEVVWNELDLFTVDRHKRDPKKRLVDDLKLTDFDIVEAVLAVEEALGIEFWDPNKDFETVQDIIEKVEEVVNGK